MGAITSSTGLISGLDTESIISQLIALESRPKTAIESRNTVLEAQQTAYQTVNAQLLSLRNASTRIANDEAFDATSASSSDEAVATVSSGVGAAVGNYSLTVKQLVGSQQTISRGYADAGATFLAPEGGTLTFNRGEARLDRETRLDELNGGQGIERGFVRITDRSGNTAVIDLTSVVTVNDVVDQLNRATGVNILAEVNGDALTIIDATGQGTSDLIIQDVGSGGTATSLGLTGQSSTGELNGTNINTVGKRTYVSTLNDGNGIRAASALDDFNLTTNGGGSFDINISNALTLEDVIDTIETASGGEVTATFNADGNGLQLTDNTGSGAGFAITALNDSKAALDLGILGSDDDGDGDIVGGRVVSRINSKSLGSLNGGAGLAAFGGDAFATLDGTTSLGDLFQGAGLSSNGLPAADIEILARDSDGLTLPSTINLDGLTTVQDLIDEFDSATGGKVTLAIEGQTLIATDNTGGSADLIIRNANGSTALNDLGLAVSGPVVSTTSRDVDPAGGALGGAQFTVTNSAGGVGSVDLAGSESVQDILDKINDAALGVRAELNNAGTGIKLTDTAGGTDDLIVEDDPTGVVAAQLGLVGTFEDGLVDSGPLGFQYVNEGSRLDNLGVTRGKFTIQDSDGRAATVDLTQGNEQTIGDVLSEINSRGLAISARVNDTGDGLILEDTGSGAVDISISEDGSTTAADLGILGDFTAGQDIDGSFRKSIDIAATDTLQSIAQKITNAKVGVSATVINDGSPGAPFRLSLSSDKSGTGGAFTLDDGGLGLEINNVATAQDAVIFYGGDNPADALVVTSKSNTIDNLIDGASISVLATSDQPIQITVSDDPAAVTSAANDFVSSFNGLVDSLNEFDSYNADTEERGLLLGDSALSRLRTSIYNAVIGRNPGLTGQFSSLAEVGIRVGQGAKLSIDSEKFQAALAADPDGVRDLFTFEQFEIDPETGEETDVVIAQGVGLEIDKLLERLTDGTDGVLERQVAILQDQIEANNKRIESVDSTIERKRERLEREFNNLEFTLAGLQDQQAALAGLSSAQAQNQQ